MKQMILTMVLLLSILSVSAQNTKNDSIQEKFFNAKVRELVYRLNITDEQKTKFVPIYRRYNEEMRTLWRNARMQMCPKPGEKNEASVKKDGKKEAKQHKHQPKIGTSAEVAAAKKKQIELQQKAQNIEMKYLDEFAKVLDGHQLNRFFDVEKRIQKKLMERKMHPKGKALQHNGKMGKRPQDKHQWKKYNKKD
jgi:Spy/CpxP family protein refolding chaperone